MNETDRQSSNVDPGPEADPSADVADTQAPAHLEERGLDRELESGLERGRDSSDD